MEITLRTLWILCFLMPLAVLCIIQYRKEIKKAYIFLKKVLKRDFKTLKDTAVEYLDDEEN